MYSIGIDLGGTNIVAGIIDTVGMLISKISVKTPKNSSYKVIVKSIFNAAKSVSEEVGVSINSVKSFGVCSPGTVNTETGIVEFAGNLNFHNVPLKIELQNVFENEVSICNDGDAIAFAEYTVGAGRGSESLVAVTLGTGVGGGIVSDGKIISGCNFAGGEIGHMVICSGGEKCNCGRRGCFEAYSSATALIKQTKLAMINDCNSEMWKLSENNLNLVTAKTAFDAARLGDKSGLKVVEGYIKFLGCGVTNLVNIFQPDVLCICGGVSNEGDFLISPLNKIAEEERFSKYAKKQTKICTSLLGESAGVIGAALLGNI